MVTDEFHGVRVADPDRWLEDWSDPQVRAWSEAQNAATRAYLDRLPAIGAVRERITELMAGASVCYRSLQWAGGRLFALKAQPPLQQPIIVAMASADAPGSETVLVDPNAIDERGTTTIDFFRASPDGRLVAVSLSHGGTERGDVHVYETATGRKLDDVIPGVNGGTAGGSLAWNGDATGFFYTRYPRAGERPRADLDFYQQVYFHRLGEPTGSDRYEIGEDFPRIAEIRLASGPDGKRILARVQEGDGGNFMHHLRRPDGSWIRLARYEDRCIFATQGADGAIYFVSRKEAPRGKVLRLAPDAIEGGVREARTLIPEAEESIDTLFSSGAALWPRKSRLFVLYQQGGPNAVRLFDLAGKPLGRLPSLPVSAVNAVAPLDDDDLLFQNQSYVSPPAWYRYEAAEEASRPTKLVESSTADFSDCEAEREWAVSRDGTRVPITILRRKATKLDGSNPTLITGYGGYGISLTPIFLPRIRLWLEQGGVYAVVNTRGGGEFGEEWHRQGNLERKQNVFDDFHRGGATHDRGRVHLAAAAGGAGRKQRRPADGGDDHPAPGDVPGLRLLRRAVRHAARGAVAQRGLQRAGVRDGQGPGAVPSAVRLLALPPRRRRDGLPGDADAHRPERSARGSLPQPQDDLQAPGRVRVGPRHPAPRERLVGPRHRYGTGRAGRRAHRRQRLPDARAGNGAGLAGRVDRHVAGLFGPRARPGTGSATGAIPG